MTRVMKIVGWVLLIDLLLSVTLVAGVVAIAGPMIEIDGQTLVQLGADDWLAAVACLSLALLIVAVVMPVALLLPLLLGVGVLAEVAGVAALVFSPVLLLAAVVWLIWRLVRHDASKPRASAGATIAG